jgi:hypothetical protein
VHGFHGTYAATSREKAVRGCRRTATLDMTEHGESHLVASSLREFPRDH